MARYADSISQDVAGEKAGRPSRLLCSTRRRMSAVAAGIALAAATLAFTAAPASAMPISDVRDECYDASGSWTYFRDPGSGASGYYCQYRDYYGTSYRDFFNTRGDYLYTCSWSRTSSTRCYVED